MTLKKRLYRAKLLMKLTQIWLDIVKPRLHSKPRLSMRFFLATKYTFTLPPPK